MTGTEILNAARPVIQSRHWYEYVFNSYRRMVAGALGFPDYVIFQQGVVILFEIKGKGDKVRPAQKKFRDFMRVNCGMFVRYIIAEQTENIEQFADCLPDLDEFFTLPIFADYMTGEIIKP